jgi:hypothetical protein
MRWIQASCPEMIAQFANIEVRSITSGAIVESLTLQHVNHANTAIHILIQQRSGFNLCVNRHLRALGKCF